MYTIEFAVDEMREAFVPIQIATFLNSIHRVNLNLI